MQIDTGVLFPLVSVLLKKEGENDLTNQRRKRECAGGACYPG